MAVKLAGDFGGMAGAAYGGLPGGFASCIDPPKSAHFGVPGAPTESML